MRGQYVPLAYRAVAPSDDAAEEIRRAIDEVRSAGRLALAAGASDVTAPASGGGDASSRPQAPKIVVVGPINRVDASTIVRIRGYAPRDFFRWFAELRGRLEDQKMMVKRCHFEEDE